MRSYCAVFGYGSLVNLETLSRDTSAVEASVIGYSRLWGHRAVTPFGNVTALSLVQNPGSRVDGILLRASEEGQKDLEAREIGYEKKKIPTESIQIPREISSEVYFFESLVLQPADREFPILLSYVEVVLAGYFSTFGTEGLQRFYDSTLGWDSYILDDRKSPIYPRYFEPPKEVRNFIEEKEISIEQDVSQLL